MSKTHPDREILQHCFHGLVVQNLDLSSAVEQQMHPKAWVYGHAFEEFLASSTHLHKVADVILARELLDARDELRDVR